MAITIDTQISGQKLDSGNTGTAGFAGEAYAFLYEPLPVIITDTDSEVTEISIKLTKINNETGVTEFEEEEYAVFDYNQAEPLHVDLMQIIRQEYDANIYKYSSIDELVNDSKNIVHNQSYILTVTSDAAVFTESLVRIAFIVGGRPFVDFTGNVDENVNITEYEVNGVDVSSRWKDYPTIIQSLKAINAENDFRPNLSSVINTEGQCACGGMVYWKSRRGGWMQWGFDLKTEKYKSSYENSFETGYFEVSRGTVNGDPHIPVNYSSVSMSESISLKSLGLSKSDLISVAGIKQSPIVYYLSKPGGNLELMRVSSAQAPINSLSNGGDFSLSLSSISTSKINVR